MSPFKKYCYLKIKKVAAQPEAKATLAARLPLGAAELSRCERRSSTAAAASGTETADPLLASEDVVSMREREKKATVRHATAERRPPQELRVKILMAFTS